MSFEKSKKKIVKKRNKEMHIFFKIGTIFLNSSLHNRQICSRHQIDQAIQSQDTDFHIFA